MFNFEPVWAFKRTPRPDEIFSSWLLRTAKAHGAQLHTFCTLSLGKREIWTRDIDFSASKSLLSHCAKLSEESIERIEGMTLQKALHLGKRAAFTPWVLSLGVFHRQRKGRGIQFCPECWRDDGEPYFRKKWRYAFMTECDVHESISLIDECPHCHSSLVPHRSPRLDFAKCAHCHKQLDWNRSNAQNDYAAWMQQFLSALSLNDEFSNNILEASNWHSTCKSQSAKERGLLLRGLRTLLMDIRNVMRSSKPSTLANGRIFEQLAVQERRYWLGVLGSACYSGSEGLLRWLNAHLVTQRKLSMEQYPPSLQAILSQLPSGNIVPKQRGLNLLEKLSKLRLEHSTRTASYRFDRAQLLLSA